MNLSGGGYAILVLSFVRFYLPNELPMDGRSGGPNNASSMMIEYNAAPDVIVAHTAIFAANLCVCVCVCAMFVAAANNFRVKEKERGEDMSRSGCSIDGGRQGK